MNCKLLIICIGIILLLILVILNCFKKDKFKNNIINVKKYKIIDITKDNLFNMSYMINKDNYLYGYGRNKTTNKKQGHNKLYRKIIDINGNIISNITEIILLDQVKDEYVGEVKCFLLNDKFYLYTYFFGEEKKSLDIFPKWASRNSKNLYFKSYYKNYLWNTNSNKVVPLFYDKLPSKELTNKNFLFFENNLNNLVITNVSPHMIFKLDINSGYMIPYAETENNLHKIFEGYNICLSGGPIKILNKKCYLVAGHIAKGGWGGLRKTFFYTFRDHYPFDILSYTDIIDFGFSKNLEYCNQIFDINNNLYISLGVNDDYSVLISLPINYIISLLKKN